MPPVIYASQNWRQGHWEQSVRVLMVIGFTIVVYAVLFEAWIIYSCFFKVCAGAILTILLLFAFDFWRGDHKCTGFQ
jgi:hypothetical protein